MGIGDIIVIGWIVTGFLAVIIGANKNEHAFVLITGLFLGPIGLLSAILSHGWKLCGYCKKKIHRNASICPFCQRELIENKIINSDSDKLFICGKCNSEVISSAKFCPNCGNEFKKEKILEESKEEKRIYHGH
jgi:predicted amidophosphoribosyltransferase